MNAVIVPKFLTFGIQPDTVGLMCCDVLLEFVAKDNSSNESGAKLTVEL